QGRVGSGNIEDRRGMGGRGLAVGGGLGGLVLVLLMSALTGRSPTDFLEPSAPSSETGSAPSTDDPQYQFVSVVLKDTEDTWGQIFAENSQTYEAPALVLFCGASQSACG